MYESVGAVTQSAVELESNLNPTQRNRDEFCKPLLIIDISEYFLIKIKNPRTLRRKIAEFLRSERISSVEIAVSKVRKKKVVRQSDRLS